MDRGIVEHAFETVVDAELIDVMGEATRDESTAIAQRLAAVAELYVRRCGALAELNWCCIDGCDAVAEISAAQNISHTRAVGQVQLACALQHRLPAVAKAFARGVIDFRMVVSPTGAPGGCSKQPERAQFWSPPGGM